MPRPSSLIRSVSSASSMKRSGSSRPSRGWCQRASASTAQLRPLPSSTSGWKYGLMCPCAMASRRSSTSAWRASSASYMPGEKIALRDLPAGLGGVHREVGVAQQLVGRARARRSRARRRCSRARARRAPPRCSGASSAPSTRSAARSASTGVGACSSSTANSSPPRRAARSSSRSDARRRSATVTSSASPAACPSVSLTPLKSSRSRNMHGGRVVVARERGLDAQREERAVGEARQRIVPRLVRQALLELRHGRQRARRLAALERAAGVRADRLEQPPLARAERLAALDGEQADDARLAAQRDDDRGRQAEAREPHAALGPGAREVDRRTRARAPRAACARAASSRP